MYENCSALSMNFDEHEEKKANAPVCQGFHLTFSIDLNYIYICIISTESLIEQECSKDKSTNIDQGLIEAM